MNTTHDETQTENYNRVISIVKKFMVIIAAVNTPYIMEFGGRYRDYAGVDEIEHVIKMSFNDDRDKLIIFVPIKCEKYTRSPSDREKLLDKVQSTFSGTMGLTRNPVYQDRIAIAVLPIHTVGNAFFSRFGIKDREITQEVYLKNRSTVFTPKDADQPLRYAMSFLLSEIRKTGTGFWGHLRDWIFARDTMSEAGRYIRDGIKEEGFRIICGRNLIGI